MNTPNMLQVFNTPSSMQTMATPFGTAHSQAATSSHGALDAGSAEHHITRDNPIQQRARAWALQRQQEQSVLSQHDSSELQLAPRTQSSVADAAGSSIRSLQRSSSPPHDTWHPQQSSGGGARLPHSLGFGRRQSEPSRSMEDEWPVLGTPSVALHLPHTPPVHLPPPSPVQPPHRTPQQAAGTQTPAAFGLQWAANLARGAEWMGEATGLRFLTRPFSRTVAGMTGNSTAAAGATNQGRVDEQLPGTSTGHRASLDVGAHSLHRSSLDQQISTSAPSNGSMSYRERLLIGSKGQQSSISGQTNRQSMVRISPSNSPPHGSQIGFPSQQELLATHSASQPSSSCSAAAGPSSSSAGPVSALSLSREQQAAVSEGHRQAEPLTEAQTPAGPQPSAISGSADNRHNTPQAVPVLSQAAPVCLCCSHCCCVMVLLLLSFLLHVIFFSVVGYGLPKGVTQKQNASVHRYETWQQVLTQLLFLVQADPALARACVLLTHSNKRKLLRQRPSSYFGTHMIV